jgi:hypothetical protein
LHWLIAYAREGVEMKRRRHVAPFVPELSAFGGFRFPPEVIVLAVRWYLRFGQSYRDLEELLAERSIDVDHVTLYRGVQRFTPLLIDAAGPCRHAAGSRWFVDETYVKALDRRPKRRRQDRNRLSKKHRWEDQRISRIVGAEVCGVSAPRPLEAAMLRASFSQNGDYRSRGCFTCSATYIA